MLFKVLSHVFEPRSSVGVSDDDGDPESSPGCILHIWMVDKMCLLTLNNGLVVYEEGIVSQLQHIQAPEGPQLEKHFSKKKCLPRGELHKSNPFHDSAEEIW